MFIIGRVFTFFFFFFVATWQNHLWYNDNPLSVFITIINFIYFRVYQDKERAWEREMKRLKALHESRLRTGAQKSLKLEQMLMMQTYQVKLSQWQWNFQLLTYLMYNDLINYWPNKPETLPEREKWKYFIYFMYFSWQGCSLSGSRLNLLETSLHDISPRYLLLPTYQFFTIFEGTLTEML